MKTQLAKWGNSLAIRLPRALTDQIGIHEGSSVEIIPEETHLIVRKPGYTLKGLLAQVTPENLHTDTDTGEPRGKEIW